MSGPLEIEVPDDAGVFLAIASGNYYDADLAFWSLKSTLAGHAPTPAQQAHLDQLRQRRKDTYADLVTWCMTVEAQRLADQGVVVD